MEEKQSAREALKEILSKMGISISTREEKGEITVTLKDETGKQLVEFRDASEEAAYERMEKALLAAILRHKLAEVFGDQLEISGVGVIVIK